MEFSPPSYYEYDYNSLVCLTPLTYHSKTILSVECFADIDIAPEAYELKAVPFSVITGNTNSFLRETPRTNAEGGENPKNKRNFEWNLLKLHKKPPKGEQRGRFLCIFAPDG